jgi:hypothetical protein
VTNPDATCRRCKPKNRKATQNKTTKNAISTVVLLLLRKNFEQLFLFHRPPNVLNLIGQAFLDCPPRESALKQNAH